MQSLYLALHLKRVSSPPLLHKCTIGSRGLKLHVFSPPPHSAGNTVYVEYLEQSSFSVAAEHVFSPPSLQVSAGNIASQLFPTGHSLTVLRPTLSLHLYPCMSQVLVTTFLALGYISSSAQDCRYIFVTGVHLSTTSATMSTDTLSMHIQHFNRSLTFLLISGLHL